MEELEIYLLRNDAGRIKVETKGWQPFGLPLTVESKSATKNVYQRKIRTSNKSEIAMTRKVILEGNATCRMMSHRLGQRPLDAQLTVEMNTHPMAKAST